LSLEIDGFTAPADLRYSPLLSGRGFFISYNKLFITRQLFYYTPAVYYTPAIYNKPSIYSCFGWPRIDKSQTLKKAALGPLFLFLTALFF